MPKEWAQSPAGLLLGWGTFMGWGWRQEAKSNLSEPESMLLSVTPCESDTQK